MKRMILKYVSVFRKKCVILSHRHSWEIRSFTFWRRHNKFLSTFHYIVLRLTELLRWVNSKTLLFKIKIFYNLTYSVVTWGPRKTPQLSIPVLLSNTSFLSHLLIKTRVFRLLPILVYEFIKMAIKSHIFYCG